MQYLSVRLGSALGEIDIGSVESISPLIYNIHSINRLALNMADKLYYLSPSPTTVQPPLYPIYKMGCVTDLLGIFHFFSSLSATWFPVFIGRRRSKQDVVWLLQGDGQVGAKYVMIIHTKFEWW